MYEIRTNLFIKYILYVYLILLRTENVYIYVEMSISPCILAGGSGRGVITGVSSYRTDRGLTILSLRGLQEIISVVRYIGSYLYEK